MLKLTVEKPSRKYEAVIILNPDASEEEQKTFFRKYRDTVKSFKGEMNHIDTWGKRRLANSIDRFKVGTYFHLTFEAQPEAIQELERTMRINDKVLRFVHQRLDDRKTITQHVETFREVIIESKNREQEREAKAQARRAAQTKRR